MSKSSLYSLIALILFGLAGGPVAAQESDMAGVNINTATVSELADRLDGVGEVKAEAIVAYRENMGQFASVDELMQVSGIGSAILEDNRDAVRVE